MKLSEALLQIDCSHSLILEGDFEVLEQCTRIRAEKALTYLDREKFLPALEDKHISCVICTPELARKLPEHIAGVATAESPKLVFFKLHNFLAARQERRPTKIDPSARISPQAYIAPFNVVIGKNVEIQPFAAIGEHTVIEDGVRICYGTIVSSQSFTSVGEGEGMFLAEDAGSTRIEQGAEICGQCDIARGTLQLDTTVIGAYTKLDAKVHIGHGSVLGKRVLVPSGAHIAGNCVVGDDVWIGVNATVSNRVKLGDGARVSLGSVVTKDVPAGQTVTGNFAIDHQRFMKNLKLSVIEHTNMNQTSPPPRTFRVGIGERPERLPLDSGKAAA